MLFRSRFNTTSGGLEYYNGTTWNGTGSAFTTIVEQQFIGTGSQTNFTLSQTATTASVIVSINGVLQIGGASYAYTVSGTTLTFTEAPAVGDVINARVVTATSVIRALAGQNGAVTVSADNYAVLHANSLAGSGANVTAFLSDGTTAWRGTPNVSVGTSPTIVHTFRADFYRSAKYTISVHNSAFAGSGAYEVSEVMVIHDGTTAYRTQYNRVSTLANSGPLGSVTTSIVNGGTYANVNVYYTGLGTGNWVSVRADLTMYQPGSIYY